MDRHADARGAKRRKRIYGMTVNNNNMRRVMREKAAKVADSHTRPARTRHASTKQRTHR